MLLAQQAAIVTGAGSGMGAATAKLLASAGMKVALLDIDQQKAEEVINSCEALQQNGLALACDVSDQQSTQQAFEQARAANGPVRLLVNCAGIAPGARLAGKEGPHDFDLFQKVISVNLIGTFNTMRLAAAEMTALSAQEATGERGVIINTASIAAYEGQIGQTAYAASKGGVVAMTLPAARELAHFGIRVVTIAPGVMETPMLAGMSETVRESLVASTLFPKRLGLPQEYAQLVLHICENAYINGETIRLDGAVRLGPK